MNEIVVDFNRSLLDRKMQLGVYCTSKLDYDLISQWLDSIGVNMKTHSPKLPCVVFPFNGSIGYPAVKYKNNAISMNYAMDFESRATHWRDCNPFHPMNDIPLTFKLSYDQYFDIKANNLLIFTIVEWEKSVMETAQGLSNVPQPIKLTFPRTMLVGQSPKSEFKPATVFWLGEDGTALFTYRAIDKLGAQYGQWATQHGLAKEITDDYEVPMELKDIINLVYSRAWFCAKVAQDEEGAWFTNPIMGDISMFGGVKFYNFSDLVWLSEDEYFAGVPNKRNGKPLTKLVKHV